MILSLAAIGLGLGLILSAWLTNRKRKRIRQELIAAAERSVPVMAYPIMVNQMLLTRKGAVAPALTIASFEPDVKNDEMAEIVGKLRMIAFAEASYESKRAVLKMLKDEEYTPGRRRAIPDDLTGGRRVYAFDLMMFGDYLPTDTLKVPLVPCLAEPGESGTIQMVPWWIVARALEAETT